MVLINILISFLGGILFYKKYNSFVNSGTIFLFYWTFIIFMDSLKLYNLKNTSTKAYFLIFLGLIGFILGTLLSTNYKFKITSNNYVKKTYTYVLNYRILLLLEIIIISFCIYRIGKIALFLSKGHSWWEVRLMATSGEGGYGSFKGTDLEQFIYEIIIAPVAYLIAPILVAEILIGKKKKNMIIINIMTIVLFSISTVSRSILSFLIIYLVFGTMLVNKNNKKKISRRTKFKFVFLIILMVVIIYKVTMLRNSESDLFKNIYAYIAGALPLLSLQLHNSNTSSIRTHGMMSLFGFLYPFLLFLNYTGIFKYGETYNNVKYIKDSTEIFKSIGDGINMNAYTTLFYNFYIDFGLVGVIVGSLLFGMVTINSYKRFIKNRDPKRLVIYLILIQFILFSVARIYTIYPTRALSLVWVHLLYNREKKDF